MKIRQAFAAVAVAMLARAALATNAAPLGLELGIATLTQVKKDIGGRSALGDGGTNRYTGGPMLKGGGDGLGIEGLSNIVFIFDREQRLAGVIMTLPKGGMDDKNFNRTLDMLAGKYKLVQKQVPFVGNKSARLRLGESVVELDAPHLSFDMELRYLTDKFLTDFNARSQADETERRRKQAGQL
jgi:hypothetical protein